MDVKLPDGTIVRGVPDGMTKAQLAEKLKANGMNVPDEWLAPAAPVEDQSMYGGAGGYNPMQGMLGGAALKLGESLGMTPENTADPVRNAMGPAETALQYLTSGASYPLSGLAGIGQGVKNLFSEGMPAADRVRQIQESLTYQPRTGAGAGMSRVVGAPGEAYAAGTNALGEKVTDVTGSPALGATIKTAADIAPTLAGTRLVKPTIKPEPKRTGKYTPKSQEPEPVPTTEQLTRAAKDAYAANKDAGIVVQPESYDKALTAIRNVVKEEGLDKTLHPKTSAVLARLEEASGKPLTLQEAETLRKIAMDAEDDLNPVTRQPTPDARLAGKVVDTLDSAIEALSVNNDARALWARSRRSQMIDQMIHRAEIRAGANYTQAGMETALRQEFRQLAMNPRRMRGLTKDQRAAIERVAKGGRVENTLRALGKFDPTTGGMGTAISAGLAGGFAPATSGASLALPVIGYGAKRLATRATARNVDLAREALVGRGLSASPRAAAPTKQPGAAAPTQAASAGAQPQAISQMEAQMQRLAAEVARLQEELRRASAQQQKGAGK